MNATPQALPPTGVGRFLVTAEPAAKMTVWARTAAYSNWITGRDNRHDTSRETWLVTVMADDRTRFIDAAPAGVTIEEITDADDTEQYTLCAGEPGTGWADGAPGVDEQAHR